MYSTMLYTVNLGLCDYVPFSQIRSHLVRKGAGQGALSITVITQWQLMPFASELTGVVTS